MREQSGIITGIAIKQASRAPMQLREAVRVGLHFGLQGDYLGKRGKRQLTLLSETLWKAACRELNASIPWQMRRANICMAQLDFSGLQGRLLRLGREIVIEITGVSEPCDRMDEIHPGLRRALQQGLRGGLTARVRHAGMLRKGDSVALI